MISFVKNQYLYFNIEKNLSYIIPYIQYLIDILSLFKLTNLAHNSRDHESLMKNLSELYPQNFPEDWLGCKDN